MPITASPLSLAAAGLYVLVLVAAVSAAVVARGRKQADWQWRSWLLLAALFTILIAARVVDAENVLRDHLRDALRVDAEYENRREFQRVIVAGIIAIAGMAAFWWANRIARTIRGRRNFAVLAALACGFAMLFLIGLRLISLHAVDALLYGPIKLNWFGDIGLSLGVATAALFYIKVVRTRR